MNNHVITWVWQLVFVVMKHTRRTHDLIDIAACYFADSICQAVIVWD